jgi:hypothetical protein
MDRTIPGPHAEFSRRPQPWRTLACATAIFLRAAGIASDGVGAMVATLCMPLDLGPVLGGAVLDYRRMAMTLRPGKLSEVRPIPIQGAVLHRGGHGGWRP